ncbi:hypothetical protein [Paenibacillus alginolyticus]|uniref:hypothetical protein n=1 Tax=Paenibacillus alginolyticus TaxID=59839 RepID=UPI002DBC3701|nr:hypothetical protein [Paenibacillus alginolyticus]MEC0146975.1 hypothetical protein [Paenibacillus alginolyticus]
MWTYTVNLVRDLSPGVKRFIATESLFGIGVGIFGLILNLHLLDLGFSKGDIGRITSLGALTIGLASLLAGFHREERWTQNDARNRHAPSVHVARALRFWNQHWHDYRCAAHLVARHYSDREL